MEREGLVGIKRERQTEVDFSGFHAEFESRRDWSWSRRTQRDIMWESCQQLMIKITSAAPHFHDEVTFNSYCNQRERETVHTYFITLCGRVLVVRRSRFYQPNCCPSLILFFFSLLCFLFLSFLSFLLILDFSSLVSVCFFFFSSLLVS